MNAISIDENGNRIMGCSPVLEDSLIKFEGNNNILYCDRNVKLIKSQLYFRGDNSLIYLGTSNHKLQVELWHNSVCHCGNNNVYTDTMQFLLSEHKHGFIGDDNLISYGVLVRNSDPHLIYSCEDGKRINPTKSVYIGDHVWIGQYVKLLKDTQIDSGSIIGAGSIVAGKKISHNTVWAGAPARKIKENVFWDATCVHAFTEEMTEKSIYYQDFVSEKGNVTSKDVWTYYYDEQQVVEWDYIDAVLSAGTAMEKCMFLKALNEEKMKNRFVHTL